MVAPIQKSRPKGVCCAHCGGKQFVLKGAATDEAPVTCSRCGTDLGPWKTVRIGMLEPLNKKTTARPVADAVLAKKATAT